MQVLDWDADGTHDPIGTAHLSVSDLIAAANAGLAVDLTKPKGRGSAGKLRFDCLQRVRIVIDGHLRGIALAPA